MMMFTCLVGFLLILSEDCNYIVKSNRYGFLELKKVNNIDYAFTATLVEGVDTIKAKK